MKKLLSFGSSLVALALLVSSFAFAASAMAVKTNPSNDTRTVQVATLTAALAPAPAPTGGNALIGAQQWPFAAIIVTATGGLSTLTGVNIQVSPQMVIDTRMYLFAIYNGDQRLGYVQFANADGTASINFASPGLQIAKGQSVTLTLKSQLGAVTPKGMKFDIGFKSLKTVSPVSGTFPMLRHWIAI